MRVEIVDEYEINPLTMMIKPIIDKGNLYSDIYELEGVYRTYESPLSIVKKGCAYFGCSYEGRRNGTHALINVTHKAPIIIDPHTSIFMFPTTSPLKSNCIWIAHDHIASQTMGKKNTTIVSFQNNERYELPISLYSFVTQLSRTASLRVKYQQNIVKMEHYYKSVNQHYYLNASEMRRPYQINE